MTEKEIISQLLLRKASVIIPSYSEYDKFHKWFSHKIRINNKHPICSYKGMQIYKSNKSAIELMRENFDLNTAIENISNYLNLIKKGQIK